MKRKLLIVLAILNSLFVQLGAQSYYMHEAAEDSDGNAISGIVSVLMFIGIGTLLYRLFGKNKSESSSKREYNYEPKETYMEDLDDSLNNDIDYLPDEDPVPTIYSAPPVESVQIPPKGNLSFREKVLEIYADQTERFGGLLIIKEDGEYHYLNSYADERYKILADYLLENKPNNCTDTLIRVDWALIRHYRMFHENDFLPFNDIENAHVEKNDFRGGKLLALKSYYDEYRRYCCNSSVPPVDFFISIGFNETILLHKMIKQEMNYTDWHDLKVMLLHGLKSYDEYRAFSDNTLQWQERSDGWYDEHEEYLGATYEEAHEFYFGCTYAKAIGEIRKIKWEI